jgi:hypothetical protein
VAEGDPYSLDFIPPHVDTWRYCLPVVPRRQRQCRDPRVPSATPVLQAGKRPRQAQVDGAVQPKEQEEQRSHPGEAARVSGRARGGHVPARRGLGRGRGAGGHAAPIRPWTPTSRSVTRDDGDAWEIGRWRPGASAQQQCSGMGHTPFWFHPYAYNTYGIRRINHSYVCGIREGGARPADAHKNSHISPHASDLHGKTCVG